ncbi:MAG: peptidoglycan DD-metalloendopeptidase family protein [Acidobacteriota bacterium]
MALALSLLVTGALYAASTPADLQRIRKEIATLRQRLGDLQTRARTAAENLEAIELQLAIRTRELDLAVDAQSELQAQSQAIESQVAELSERIVAQKKELGTRLVVLYRMGPLSYLRVLLSIDPGQNVFDAAATLQYLVNRDARAVTSFQETQTDLKLRREALAVKKHQVDQVSALVAQQRQLIAQSRTDQARMLAEINDEGSKAKRRIAELEEKARRLERLFSTLYERKNVDQSPGTRIEDVRGALSWPVTGKVLEGFGRHRNSKFATVTISNGLKIDASEGTEVRSVFQGTVLFSQWFKGYGNLIIVDHGNRIFTLYGNTTAARVSVGDRVAAEQTIASVAASEEESGSYLYFEIRENNRPVDPTSWLR